MLYFLKEKLFLYFIKRKHFSYFQKWNPALFCQSFKIKRNPHQENFLCFRKQRPQKNFLFFSQKKVFLIFRGKETYEKFFHLRKWNFQSTKNEKRKKKTLWKCFSCFRKLNFSTPSLKGSYFLGERPMVFHRYFFKYFHFTIDFYYWFWKFLLLIPFFFTSSLFLQVFLCQHWFYYCFSTVYYCLLWWPFFVRYFIFELLYWVCYGFERAFFSTKHFYLKLLPNIWHNVLLWRLPYGLQFCLAGCRASHWCSNYRPSLSVCLKTQCLAKRTSR